MQLKTLLPATLLALSLYACSKTDNESKETIDFATYGYLTHWKEIESKTGTTDWLPISNGNTLSVFSNSIDTSKPVTGEYIYNPANSMTNIDSTGFFRQANGQLNFISKKSKDTTTLTYKFEGDSVLIATNAAVSLKYRKTIR
jgi:hypothetical protein